MTEALEIMTMEDYKALCRQDKPFILMFYAPWCGACQSMKQSYNEIAAAEAHHITLAKVNVDNPATKSLKDAHCISAFPTFVTRQIGSMSTQNLASLVKSVSPVEPAKTSMPTQAPPRGKTMHKGSK
jgi:thiol-disulfide isomerase/thioredoxin